MEFAQKINSIKKRQTQRKTKLTTSFKKLKDAHDRSNKSREEIDALTKIGNDITAAAENCQKKTCIYHHTKLYERLLKISNETLVQLQDIKKEILQLNKAIHDDREYIEKIEHGLLQSQFKIQKTFIKNGSDAIECKPIYIYKQDSISRDDDSPFTIQKDTIFDDRELKIDKI